MLDVFSATYRPCETSLVILRLITDISLFFQHNCYTSIYHFHYLLLWSFALSWIKSLCNFRDNCTNEFRLNGGKWDAQYLERFFCSENISWPSSWESCQLLQKIGIISARFLWWLSLVSMTDGIFHEFAIDLIKRIEPIELSILSECDTLHVLNEIVTESVPRGSDLNGQFRHHKSWLVASYVVKCWKWKHVLWNFVLQWLLWPYDFYWWRYLWMITKILLCMKILSMYATRLKSTEMFRQSTQTCRKLFLRERNFKFTRLIRYLTVIFLLSFPPLPKLDRSHY